MSDSDLYAPPTMQLYWDDLISDTTDLSNEELGAYVRLMARQWAKGSIPGDVREQARLAGHTAPAKMKRIMAAIGPRLKPHPTILGTVYSRRMEEVRSTQAAYARQSAERGRAGAAARWTGDALLKHRPSNADAMQTHSGSDASAMPGDGSPVSSLQSPQRSSASVRDPRSPAWQFADWFFQRAVETGVLDRHHQLDPRKWIYEQIPAADVLFTAYGEAECKARSERLFTMKAANRIRRSISVATLAKAWDWSEITGDGGVSSSAREKTAQFLRDKGLTA